MKKVKFKIDYEEGEKTFKKDSEILVSTDRLIFLTKKKKVAVEVKPKPVKPAPAALASTSKGKDADLIKSVEVLTKKVAELAKELTALKGANTKPETKK